MSTPATLSSSAPSLSATPKVSKILFTDYWCFVLLLFNVAALVTIAGIPLLLLLTPLLVHRVHTIRRVLVEGTRVRGVILRKRFGRGEWRVEYGFEAAGQVVATRNFILGFKLPVDVQQVVTVCFDPEKPTRAFLPTLYLPPSPM